VVAIRSDRYASSADRATRGVDGLIYADGAMWPRRITVALVVVAAVAAASVAAALVGGDEEGFAERPVPVAALPTHVRTEVVAHGGGRCVEQYPSVYFCVLVRVKRAHDGPSGRGWCFDDDGRRTLGMYLAPRVGGAGRCEPG
jgi:hypothetical protein